MSALQAPVLALCDPAPESTNAAWRAALAARELGRPLQLLHADRDGQRAHAIGQVLAGLAARIRERIGIEVSARVAQGDPLREATRATSEACLLVLGPRQTNALREWVLGTQAERVIRLSRAPVLVVKRHASAAYRRLLVPVDFDAGGSAAPAWAAALSRAPQMEIFHVLDGREAVSLRASGLLDAVREERRRESLQRARDRLDQFAQGLPGAAADAMAGVAIGDAAEAVIARAHAMRADLVVMGKRPRGAIADFLLGSVTQRVLASVRTDVLVVTGDAPFVARDTADELLASL